jgi:hypothetical protein
MSMSSGNRSRIGSITDLLNLHLELRSTVFCLYNNRQTVVRSTVQIYDLLDLTIGRDRAPNLLIRSKAPTQVSDS